MTQDLALEIMKSGHNVFLTGAAGSGKTYVLQQYLDYLDEQGITYTVTAPTGIAASHLGGTTVHSFFGLGIKEHLSQYDLEQLTERKYLWDRMKNLKVVIIDEVSMLSPGTFNAIDQVLRTFTFSSEPYGGIQVILSGDFFQLPPITKKSESEIRFIFETELWSELEISTCYLEGSKRHHDETLLGILNEIRSSNISETSMNHFRSRYKKKTLIDGSVTKLYTHNQDVDAINEQELGKLNTPVRIYDATTTGKRTWVERMFDSSLLLPKLKLKKGALVFFIKNNYERGYINGTLGTVVDFNVQNYPIVETVDGKKISAEPETWIKEDDGKELASIKQVPLRLAWAITIHKSQGMTLDAAEIDLSRAFEPGQGYVALSRIKSLEGLTLMGLNDTALSVDKRVRTIDEKIKQESEELHETFSKLSSEEREHQMRLFSQRMGGGPSKTSQTTKKDVLSDTLKETKEHLKKGLSIEEIAQKRSLKIQTIANHVHDIVSLYPEIDISHLQPSSEIIEKVEQALNHIQEQEDEEQIKPNGERALKPIFQELDGNISYEDIRLALLFIE